MRAVIQRVDEAKVVVDNETTGEIGPGLLALISVDADDDEQDIQWMANKISGLRIFPDGEGKMNLSALDLGYEILSVSQFTLHGRVKKGFRPSFTDAASPEKGGEKVVELPPGTVPSWRVSPVAGRNHSTWSGRVVAERSSVIVPVAERR